MPDSRCLVLFTKPAIAGRVKTRLIGDLTPEQAAELHAAFLGDLVDRVEIGNFTLRIAWALDSGDAVPESPFPGFRQQGADLGERLFHGLAHAAEDHDQVAAIGSDHPELPLSHIHSGFDKLTGGADVVLGPTTDGGYYLVGATRQTLNREIFAGIDWSTEGVLTSTLRQCLDLGLTVELLPIGADIDTPDDLRLLASRLTQGGCDCPRTIRLLERWRRISR
jgi:rSAM/selenodomain-associated transferase 1